MHIAELTPLSAAPARFSSGTRSVSRSAPLAPVNEPPGALPVCELPIDARTKAVAIFVGRGGWTNEELEEMGAAGSIPVRLTETVLRIETAAVAAAAIVAVRG